jgi:hypothetical protein
MHRTAKGAGRDIEAVWSRFCEETEFGAHVELVYLGYEEGSNQGFEGSVEGC